ncbi:MAG: TolC family protein [Mariniphaga sp.]
MLKHRLFQFISIYIHNYFNFGKYLQFVSISIYFNLFLSISTYSQSDSLNNYLEIAAKNNPTVLQKLAEYKAALQKIPQVGSLPDPELTTGIFLSPMELVGGKQLADIRLMQMFPWFGVLKAAKDEMSLMAKAKFELFRDAKLQVFYDVQSTWYELYKNQANIRISEKNLEILKSLERLSLVKFRAAPTVNSSTPQPSKSNPSNGSPLSSAGQSMGGNTGNPMGSGAPQNAPAMQSNPMGPQSGGSGLTDVYGIQIEINDLENNIALLKNQHNTILARFNSYLNRPMQVPVSTPDTLQTESLNIPLRAISDSMLTNSPMLGMLHYEQKSLEARKQMVTKMGYPMVGLGVNYSLINKNEMSTSTMNGKDMVMPMVLVTLPIYRKKYKAMQSEVVLQSNATEQGIKAAANSLQTSYYEAVQNYEDAKRRITLYSRQFQLSDQSLNILMRNFSVSGSGLPEVLRLRQQTLSYELKQVEAVADCNTAIARLKQLMANSRL